MNSARGRLATPLLCALAALAACGPTPPPRDTGPPAMRPTPTARLELRVEDGLGSSVAATLTCAAGADRATGYLRQAQAVELCRALEGPAKTTLTQRPPRDRVCAEVYGSAAKARVTGTLDGRRVDRRLARTDACQIADWDRVDQLLPDLE